MSRLMKKSFAISACVALSVIPSLSASLAPVENISNPEIADNWQMRYGPPGLPSAADFFYFNTVSRASQKKIPEAVALRREYRRQNYGASLVFDEEGFQLFLGNVHDALDVVWLRSAHIGAVLSMIEMVAWYLSISSQSYSIGSLMPHCSSRRTQSSKTGTRGS